MKPWPGIMTPLNPGIMAAAVPGIPGYISGFGNEYWWADVISGLQ